MPTPTEEELNDLIRKAEADLETARRKHPDLYGRNALPYKVIDEIGLHGIKLMRLRWLRENHPRTARLMERAGILERDLEDTEDRFLRERSRLTGQLLEQRHLTHRIEVMRAHPEITDQDRALGLAQAERDATELAIERVVHAF